VMTVPAGLIDDEVEAAGAGGEGKGGEG